MTSTNFRRACLRTPPTMALALLLGTIIVSLSCHEFGHILTLVGYELQPRRATPQKQKIAARP